MASLLLFTLLCVSTTIPSLAENIRIDCGASGSYNGSYNEQWLGDKDFVTTGKPYQLPGKHPRPFNTVRGFPSGQNNCYKNIPATKRGKTLVRTMFLYINNDTKPSPQPSFDVIYDGKHRVSIFHPEEKKSALVKSEVIYSPTSENISLCLISTSDPTFIASIEVYNLDDGMYDDLGPNECFILRQRFAYGIDNKTIISYPLDPYGRLWFPPNELNFNKLKTSAPSIDITDASNKPPEIVMSNALSAIDLKLVDLPLSLTSQPVYLALYFSEPRSLNQTEIRSFNVYLDNKLISPKPIVPVLGKAIQVIVRNLEATSKSEVTFQSTKDSNLPPLINAFEIYSIFYSHVGGYVDTAKKEIPIPDLDHDTVKKIKEEIRRSNWWQKLKLPVIIGIPTLAAGLASAFVLWKKNSKTKSHESNTLPTTSEGHGTVSGISPLIGQQLKSDAKHPDKV